MTRELTREEMMTAIRNYSRNDYSLMHECEDGVKRHRITPLFRVEVLGEDLKKVYTEKFPQLRIVSTKD